MNIVTAIVETPKGSAQKYDYDKDSHFFKLKKIMPAGLVFPFDFGLFLIPKEKMEIRWTLSSFRKSQVFLVAVWIAVLSVASKLNKQKGTETQFEMTGLLEYLKYLNCLQL